MSSPLQYSGQGEPLAQAVSSTVNEPANLAAFTTAADFTIPNGSYTQWTSFGEAVEGSFYIAFKSDPGVSSFDIETTDAVGNPSIIYETVATAAGKTSQTWDAGKRLGGLFRVRNNSGADMRFVKQQKRLK